jgi:alkanesulfonate monooxygenase SsuD/methylene tetrahydromethanopterin reductase-like flavin-dependent oxidoreductase (luciferase family)
MHTIRSSKRAELAGFSAVERRCFQGNDDMKFGVFDHVDRGASSLAELYESRLKLAEIYDRSGFHAYHIAEHHATPLGMASSPSVFLSAVAQRTTRLRLGPLVYILSLSHPLRILEEICMLDQMSNGRLEVGVGRGVSPYEIGYFGVDPQRSSKIYTEAYQIILQGLQSREINFEGEVFQLKNVPVAMECVQKPHPPIWYGMSHPNAVPWAAQNNINIVCNGPSAPVRAITDRYRQEWQQAFGSSGGALPLLGLGRHLVVGETAKEAFEIGQRAFGVWYANLMLLWRKHGNPLASYPIPEDFSAAVNAGIVIVGTPDQVCDGLKREIGIAGVNYLLTRFAFGDLTHDESVHSLSLFTAKVMPEFASEPAYA